MKRAKHLQTRKPKIEKVCAATLAAGVMLSNASPAALAVTYDLADGNVTVEAREDATYSWQDGEDAEYTQEDPYNHQENNDYVVEVIGEAEDDDSNNVTVSGDTGGVVLEINSESNVDLTLDNATINGDGEEGPKEESTSAIDIGKSSVDITLTGDNTLTGGNGHAALDTSDGSVTINGDGSLTATGGNHGAGIGGSEGESNGSVTIDGGTIDAAAGTGGAAIGGGLNGDGGTININGGTVHAGSNMDDSHGMTGAAIGGGDGGDGGTINITGGTVVADAASDSGYGAGIGGGTHTYVDGVEQGGNSGSITITGGDVTAMGGNNAAGIGGGGQGGSLEQGGAVDSITISGEANVTATGGAQGAGIGGGYKGVSEDGTGTIEISDSATVTATGGDRAAGVGTGAEGAMESIAISGGTVTAESEKDGGAGIGTGAQGSVDSIVITGEDTVVEAAGGTSAAGIGTGNAGTVGSLTISGGTVESAKGDAAGIGTGLGGMVEELKITGGDVTAAGGKNSAGIGTGDAGTVKELEITGGTVTATGGYTGAGIGGGNKGNVDSILITGDADVTATGGEGGAGIGGGYGSSNSKTQGKVGKITIDENAQVKATGGRSAAAIGSSAGNYDGEYKDYIAPDYYEKLTDAQKELIKRVYKYSDEKGLYRILAYTNGVGDIHLNGGTIYAQAGSGASAIGGGADLGNGAVSRVDSISISDKVWLHAFSDGSKFAVDLSDGIVRNSAYETLNGRFHEGVAEAGDEFVVLDAYGKEVTRFTWTAAGDGSVNRSFAVDIPRYEGNYFLAKIVPNESGETESYRFISGLYLDDSGTRYVAYPLKRETEDSVREFMKNADDLNFAKYNVTYKFQSADGTSLPEEVLQQLPTALRDQDIVSIQECATASGNFIVVTLKDGSTWTFEQWDRTLKPVINADGTYNVEIEFVGTWKYARSFSPSSDPDDEPGQPTVPSTPSAPIVPIVKPATPEAPTTPIEVVSEPASPVEEIAAEQPQAKLPQTGQNWALAGLLAVAGGLMATIGITPRKCRKDAPKD